VTQEPNIPGIVIENELGRGAHSVVFRGRTSEGTRCAVKVPRSRGRWTRWVYREAVALARVRDPNLPAVIEVGEVDDIPYLVMELVEGETLAERLARGPLRLAAALDIVGTVIHTLRAVHEIGLVHRDVKPRNLVFGAGDRVRLVDFGFATPIERAGTADAAGTPGYAAPEQLRAPARVDGRADLFAVGRVLLSCLAPQRDPATFERAEVVDEILAEASVGADVVRIARDLLATDPDLRYPDATAVLLDLVLIGNGEAPLGATKATRTPRARPWVGRTLELQRVIRGWSDRGGTGSVAVVTGARGGGKSRFLDAAVERWRAGRRGPALAVRCREGDPPLATLRRLADAYLEDAHHSGAMTAAHRAIREAVGDDLEPFAALIAPRLVELLGATRNSAPASMSAFPEAAAELFVRLVKATGPMLIAIDDAPWADPASSEVLSRLAHRATDAPIALLLSARPEHGGFLERVREVEPARLTSIALGDLDEAEIAALVAVHLGRSDIDAATARRIAAVSDRTPLGVLETLRAFLDAGALRPQQSAWTLDHGRADKVILPEGSLELLERRVAELPPATRTVLEAAAVLGTTFEDGLLAEILEICEEDLDFGLADARRAGIVEPSGRAHHAFNHEGYRETTLRSLAPAAQRRFHQAAAVALERRADTSLEALCRKALHYAHGELTSSPDRAFQAARSAAEVALSRGDEQTALRFLGLAQIAAGAASVAIDGTFLETLGEAHLRTGALAESLKAFEGALALVRSPLERARVLGRIAWVHQASADPDGSWASLDRAFAELGERMPRESARSAADTFVVAARRGLGKLRRTRQGPHSPELSLLCDLHYQNVRLGLEYGKPLRIVQSTLAVLELSELTGRSRARARGLALYGFVLRALGRDAAGIASVAEAEAMARSLGDPATEAFCGQVRVMAACWAGQLDEALVVSRRLLDQAHFLELNEFCHDIANADLIEALRGRTTASRAWLDRGVARMRRSVGATDLVVDYLFHRVTATLSAQDAMDEVEDPWLLEQLHATSVRRSGGRGFFRVLSWGARARAYTESGELGAGLEDLVREFEAEGISPRSAHPFITEYYVALAHARVHPLLALAPTERRAALDPLRKAAGDLRLAGAKIPLFRSHALVVDAHLAWFEGRSSDSARLFREATALAEEETCPWVLYAVARARAHQLREAGKPDAALDQARLAESLARENGATVRARWIRDEFALPSPAVEARSSSAKTESRVSSRQLAALLHVLSSGARALRPEDQAAAVMNDILLDLECERGALLFQPDLAAGSRLALGRTRAGEALSCEGWRDDVLRTARETGSSWPSDESDWLDHIVGHDAPDSRRVIVVPLILHERTAGAICLERARDAPPFGTDERELLFILAKQVPLALEMARLVAEREQLQASLQQAQRMEAVGQLAGGVAHDFNNMLTAIQTSLVALHDRVRHDDEASAELDLIASASKRAGQLTTKLLAFSRHQPVPLAPCDVNELLRGLVPMLRRLVGSAVTVSLELEHGAHLVSTDRAAFEQALVNLAVNARDAMPSGGKLVISTTNAVLDAAAVRRGAAREGAYLRVVVRDDGQGISPELVSRVFEPFFTTKGPGGGTGLGLTTVYAFVKNCGGHIDVTSEVGQGTSFRIHLPAELSVRPVRVRRATPVRENRVGAETILVVDDEHLVARSIQKTLQRKGYEVLLANDAARAIELVQTRASDISLVIIDMLMPGMTGPELGKRLEEMQLPAKLLYVSGFAPGNLPLQEPDFDSSSFLQKPFTPSDLLGRVGQLLDST
jgi:signal transduction histidine kinase/CheY-like chemotaxis protein